MFLYPFKIVHLQQLTEFKKKYKYISFREADLNPFSISLIMWSLKKYIYAYIY